MMLLDWPSDVGKYCIIFKRTGEDAPRVICKDGRVVTIDSLDDARHLARLAGQNSPVSEWAVVGRIIRSRCDVSVFDVGERYYPSKGAN